MTANVYVTSFGGDKNVLRLVLLDITVSILKTTELYTFKR